MEWYIKKGVSLDLHHFLKRAKDTKDWMEYDISEEQFVQLLNDKIDSISFDKVKEDVVRFIIDDEQLTIWSPMYFKDLVGKMKFG